MRWKLLKFVLPVLMGMMALQPGVSQSQPYQIKAARLGTVVGAQFYCARKLNVDTVEKGFLSLLDSLNRIFSDYLKDSEVNKLVNNYRPGESVEVSPALLELLAHAQQCAAQTKGKFDVTIGALTRLWRAHLARQKVPPKRKIRRAKRAVGFENLLLDFEHNKVTFLRKGMGIDFGGIAKGYIADQLGKHFRKRGITQYLIDLGGDILVGDPPPNRTQWIVSVGWASKKVALSNLAIATSGPEYQFFIHRNKRYSHIIDPNTGWGISDPYNSTVISRSGWLSDAVASSAVLLRAGETLALAKSQAGVELMVQASGKLYQSAGFCNYVLSD